MSAGYDVVGSRALFDPENSSNKIRHFKNSSFDIDINNVLYSTIEFCIVCKINFFEKNLFGNNLGVGSGTPFGSDEGVDFIIRSLDAGCRAKYSQDLLAFYPDPINKRYPNLAKIGSMYAQDRDYFLRKYSFPLEIYLREFLSSVVTFFQSIAMFDLLISKYHINVFRVNIIGYLITKQRAV